MNIKTTAIFLFSLFLVTTTGYSSEYDDLVGKALNKEDCECFKDNRTDTVLVTVVDNNHFYIVGLKKKNIVWKFEYPIEEIDPAETGVNCCREGKTIEVVTTERVTTYSFDGENITEIDSMTKFDPSIETAIALAVEGKKSELDALRIGTLYPQNYISSSLIEEALTKGHEAALKVYKNKQPLKAAERMKMMFKVTYDIGSMVFSVEGEDFASDIEKYLALWKGMKLERDKYLEPVNDYGFFLQEAGDHEEAIKVLKLVINENPARVVAYLNIADSYWALKNSKQAKEMYKKYVMLMKEQKKNAKIVPRAIERAK